MTPLRSPTVSSLAPAPERAAPEPPRAAQNAPTLRLGVGRQGLIAAGLAAALALVAFVTKAGDRLAPNTWVQIVLLLVGAAAAIAVLVVGAAGRRSGLVTLILFAVLAALTALSITWSVVPDASWLEANRTLSYLAVFGIGIACSRLFGGWWRAPVGAVALFAVTLSAYALLVKVFPATFAPNDSLGRLSAPFGYWNATGLIAALGLPPCVWLGARRQGAPVLRGLAPPAIAILLSVVVLSYSRSAVLASAAGIALWFAVVPLRLRGAFVLVLGGLGAAAISGWALATHPLTRDHIALSARTTAGHGFGIVIVLVVLVLTAAGLAGAFAVDRTVLGAQTRRRLGTVLIGLVALLPLAGIAALAASQRGFTGEVSHVWSTLTTTKESVGDNPGRLIALGSSRARDWNDGWSVFTHDALHGAGAAGYATARLRYSDSIFRVDHAHSYIAQTLADFGVLGILVNIGLLIAWWLAARRPLRANSPESRESPERLGLLTLLCVVFAFGLHSTIDWTWFIPGAALPALLCAGWLAGRGSLDAPVGRRPERVKLSLRPAIGLACTAIATVTLLAAWAIWQPLRADNATAAVLTALTRGNTATAFSAARTAAARNPVSVQPLWLLAELYSRIGDEHAAHAELVDAIKLQRQNPATWQQLGLYDVTHGRLHEALGVLERAQRLDLGSVQTAQAITQAKTALAAIKAARH
jgi:hypothetical protein